MRIGRFCSPTQRTLCVVVIALLSFSCSSEKKSDLNPARGKVLYKDQAAGGVNITFHPVGKTDAKAARPIAISEESGAFTVMTGDEEGAPAGEYTVTMIWPQAAPVPNVKKGESISMTLGADPIDKLNGKLANVRQSNLKVKIEKGVNEIPPFKLQ